MGEHTVHSSLVSKYILMQNYAHTWLWEGKGAWKYFRQSNWNNPRNPMPVPKKNPFNIPLWCTSLSIKMPRNLFKHMCEKCIGILLHWVNTELKLCISQRLSMLSVDCVDFLPYCIKLACWSSALKMWWYKLAFDPLPHHSKHHHFVIFHVASG